MHVAQVFFFDTYGLYLHKQLMVLPGLDTRAVSEFVRENAEKNNLSTPIAYAFVMPERQHPMMVVF